MIKFGESLSEAMRGRKLQFFNLIRLGDYYRTTYCADIYYLDPDEGTFNTYRAIDELTAIDPPKVDTSLDKNRCTIAIADPTNAWGSSLETLVGQPAHIIFGVIDPITNNPIGCYDANGTRYTYTDSLGNVKQSTDEDLFLMYKGTVDSASYQYETDTLGAQVLSVNLTNPFHNLDKKRSFYSTKRELRKKNPNDTAFDQVYTGSTHALLRWGKYFGTE